jgi:hypothetical protein
MIWYQFLTKGDVNGTVSTSGCLYADGEDLEKIRCRLDNIPITKNRGCFWYGDMAQFILENVQLMP